MLNARYIGTKGFSAYQLSQLTCVGPLSTTDAISSLFFVILQVFACLSQLVQV